MTTPWSYDLESKGRFLRVAQHLEAADMVAAVLGLVVMDALYSTSYKSLPPNSGISPRAPLKLLLSLRENIYNTIHPVTDDDLSHAVAMIETVKCRNRNFKM